MKSTKEEIVVLVSDEIKVDSSFPVYSKNKDRKIGSLLPKGSQAVEPLLDRLVYGFAEATGLVEVELSVSKLDKIVKKNRANVNLVIDSPGGTVFTITKLCNWIQDLNDAGHVTRAFVPWQASSAAGRIFSYTAERHVAIQTLWSDHLASIIDREKGFSEVQAYTEKSLIETLRRLFPRGTNFDVESLIRSSEFEDKAVLLIGPVLEMFGIAKMHKGREELLRAFTEITGINVDTHPDLKSVFLNRKIGEDQ